MLNLRQQSVSVNREKLIEALKKNLKAHVAELKVAQADYEAAVIKALEETLTKAKAGDFSKPSVNIKKPESHENDFVEIIEMMEMSVDENISLDREAFLAYFKNEWPWKQQFEMLAASYKA